MEKTEKETVIDKGKGKGKGIGKGSLQERGRRSGLNGQEPMREGGEKQ